jgi:hypothetical protein
MSEGTIGELASLLTQAAVEAVRSGTEQINEHVLTTIAWQPPSERKRAVEQMF